VSVEERFLDALDYEDEEEGKVPLDSSWRRRQQQRLQRKNQAAITEFLGEGRRTNAVGILPRYYGKLLTWALHQYLKRDGWKIVATLGYQTHEALYIDVTTSDGSCENLLMDGQMFIEKGNARLIVTVDVNPRRQGSVKVDGPIDREDEVKVFVSGVMTIAREENFYWGKKIEFAGWIRFLNIGDKSWGTITLDAATKAEIKANTIEFLKRSEQWCRYGIPLKRGILLAGEPGTGKTVICKALMSEAEGITCITTNGYALDADDYITELYELAEDLSPSIVFIEDIDLIGQNRLEFGYQSGSALVSLLAVLDGVEQHKEIVTVATTNCLETLDRALSQRPSRFDRVIKLSRPSIEQRRELIGRLCQKIPLDENTQEYIAHKAENCTPAHLQEIVYSLVIQCPAPESGLTFDKSDIDRAISRINDKNLRHIGFGTENNHNGNREDLPSTIRLAWEER